MYPPELCTAHSLCSISVDDQWGILRWPRPEVHNNIFGSPHIEEEIAILPPLVAHVSPVVCLIVVGDEAHNSCVTRKIRNVVDVLYSVLCWFERKT